MASWTRQSAIHGTQHATRPTTTSPTHVGSELQRPLGNRISHRLRDHGLGARVASWTRQPAIHSTQHATCATTTSPTHIGGNLQCPLGNRVSQRLRDHGLGDRVASWPRQSAIHGTCHTTRATTTSPTHIGGNLERPPGNRVSQRLRDHGLGVRVASWTRQSAIHGTQHATRATTTSPTHVGIDLQRPLAREPRLTAFARSRLGHSSG